MGLSNSKKTPSSSSDVSKRCHVNNAPSRRYRHQAFPFSYTIIRYITNNPASSKLYQKMIQSCKHFFIRNPIIIVPELYYDRFKRWHTKGTRPSEYPWRGERAVYLNELTSKIWITNSLDVWGRTQNNPIITSFMPRIYQCDATSVFIGDQMFSFNDFMVIASKCEMLHLSSVVVTNNDEVIPKTEGAYFETPVSLEALVKALPNVKEFIYILPDNCLNIITTKTAEELLKIPHFLGLDKFEIFVIPEVFDIKSFYGHITENKKTKFNLHFSNQISDAYKTRLQTIVCEIIETENRDYKVPNIVFSGITIDFRDKIFNLYNFH